MAQTLTVATAPKTATFQMRINPEIKTAVEEVFARCGMTLTDAINIFIQQSLNAEGMPMLVTTNSKDAMREQAIQMLTADLEKGEASAKKGIYTQEDILREFGFGA